MNRSSMLYQVLSPEKIPALDMGAKLSPMNNSNHPTLKPSGAVIFAEAVNLIEHNLKNLLPLLPMLRDNGIDTVQFSLALNSLNSYVYILNATLDLEKNAKNANYAFAKKAA
jgi:hypothetical protein